MSLTPGTRLGVFELIEPIGRGGMGEVYRARDTRLDRDVAIKVLPEAFAHDAERLARFLREAKTLASLNHPNIAIIHGLEESDGIRALVMEFVEGDDLSQRIARGAIPIELGIARPIDFAHAPATNFLDQGEDAKTGAGSEGQIAGSIAVTVARRRLVLVHGLPFYRFSGSAPWKPQPSTASSPVKSTRGRRCCVTTSTARWDLSALAR